ncbi:hypothetical protein E0Z10_g3783 [Xylaria hypoxylon]|uniref:Uncharacterized protein n=1 Tax=Xylaria hypoxylon TaxID=37992 RepID=A0A4Z0Z6I6_9PEZI|nr:hypothetical protein E0Z10_g3783 [Xylaria hypoxylon]
MSTKQTSPILKIWYQWKSLRLPWRKRFFVGRDPQGNTYYELRQPRGDAPETAAYRRLVHYPRSTPYSEVKVPPAWHQWLRHQRPEPPSMVEQASELQRQARMKLLAAEADARWEAKPSLLDMPAKTSQSQDQRRSGGGGQSQQRDRDEVDIEGETQGQMGEEIHAQTSQQTSPHASPQAKMDNNPWKRAQRGAPGETWQPQSWTPAPAKKR